MKTITRQRKEQLTLEARGLCRYSENHGQHVVGGMCYECAIRHRKTRSPRIPDWWPLSIHYSERRHQEFEISALRGDLIGFADRYSGIYEEVFFLAAKGKFLTEGALGAMLLWAQTDSWDQKNPA